MINIYLKYRDKRFLLKIKNITLNPIKIFMMLGIKIFLIKSDLNQYIIPNQLKITQLKRKFANKIVIFLISQFFNTNI